MNSTSSGAVIFLSLARPNDFNIATHYKPNGFGSDISSARDKYAPSSSDVYDLNSGELAVGLEGQLQVSIYKQLVETFGVACVGHIVHLKLDRGSAAAGRRRVDVAKDTTCTKNNGAWALELHNGNLLADTPEHLHRNADIRLRVRAQDERLRRLIKTIEPGGAGAVGAHQGVFDSIGRGILHKAGPVEEKVRQPGGDSSIPVGLARAKPTLIAQP